MSCTACNSSTEEADHRHCFLLNEGPIANRHEEHQSTNSELPTEIPDSQPDQFYPHLPAEISDSQPDPVYHTDSPFGDPEYSEVSSQLSPIRDIHIVDANIFNSGDYDLSSEGSLSPNDLSIVNKENIDPLINHFDRVRRRAINDSDYNESASSSSSSDTEIVPGGTRLTERLKDRIYLHKKGINCNGRLPLEASRYKDFDVMEENCTQPATQQIPRKKSFDIMLDEQDESDIICILLPTSPWAHKVVELTAQVAAQHILQNHAISNIYQPPDEDLTTGSDTRTGDDSNDEQDLNPRLASSTHSKWEGPANDIALRFSSKVRNLGLGFTFGHNPKMNDLLLGSNTTISNRHFRIFMKNNGSLMIEDTSLNGTIVDGRRLRGPKFYLQQNPKVNLAELQTESQRTLCNGDTIEIPLIGKQSGQSIRFSVKMPMRSEIGAEKYLQNCVAYIKCVEQAERQHGFLAEARKKGNAPVTLPAAMHALPQGVRPGTSANTSLLTAATASNVHGMRWSGGSKYNVLGLIGSGAFANVYKLSHKSDGEFYAAKQLDKRRFAKDGSLSSKIYNELNLIKGLRHPNIVKYVDHHETPQWLFIVMEYIQLGDLGQWIRAGTPMPEYMCQHVARQIVQAVDYLHQRGITHRDLKPDNVLMDSDCPFVFKLSDFGLSKIVTDDSTFLTTFCGTMMYCAPEVYPGYQRVKDALPAKRTRASSKNDHTLPYEHSVDIWGLGAVLYHLLSGEPPFIAKHDPQGQEMLEKLMRHPVNWERLKMVGISNLGVEFLKRMLVTDASKRASDQELLDHAWICGSEGPADASDCVLSDPTERLNVHASQLSLAEEEGGSEETGVDTTEDTHVSKRARTWVPDMNRNVWGQTPSMVVRNQQLEDRAEGSEFGIEYPSVLIPGENVGEQRQPNRLFGEIGASALASSGALGVQGNRALEIQGSGTGSYDVSLDDLHDVSRATSSDGASAATEFIKDDHQGTTQDHKQTSQRLNAPTPSGGAPSLLGAELLVGQLNMASIGSGASAQAENGKPATPNLYKDPDSPSSRLHPKRSSQDILPPESEGASKRLKTAGVEHASNQPFNTSERYPTAPHASIEDLRQKTMPSMSRPGSRDSNNGGYEGQTSLGAYKSNYTLPSTAFNSRESSQALGGEDDVIMGDDRDSDDEVSRLEEALAAAKAKKAAKAASSTHSRPVSQASSRPASSHRNPASTAHQAVVGSANFDATANVTTSATASFVKPPLRFGKLQPTRGSIHTPSIYITERLTTYGRRPDSSFVHPDPREDRIPKQALDIQMWYPGIETDIEAGKTNWMTHPKLEAILRTRTSLYVLVNGVKLKKGQGEYLWGRLRTGDEITVVEPKVNPKTARDREYLRFRCEFFVGLSKIIRKPGEKAFVVEVEKDKFKVAEERKSRESSAASLGVSKRGESSTNKDRGTNRDIDMLASEATDAAAGS